MVVRTSSYYLFIMFMINHAPSSLARSTCRFLVQNKKKNGKKYTQTNEKDIGNCYNSCPRFRAGRRKPTIICGR